jgi:hypothetical protein
MNFKAMYEDQKTFNQQVWDKRTHGTDPSNPEVIDRIRHLALGSIEEVLEFLRTFEFKIHRRSKLRLQNVAHSHEELIDQFKYWLSLCDVSGFPMDRLEEMYYAKSRVVQYRFQEEWVKELVGPTVVVDIDQVLADYITGICNWGKEYGPSLLSLPPDGAQRLCRRLDEIEQKQMWVNAETVGVSHLEWQRVKHDFRTKGGKRHLPVFKDARPFLEWCRQKGWTIILMTSRPIVEYPNIFTDTLTWLSANKLPHDYVWWSMEKGERIEEANFDRSQIVFAVDDSERYVKQFRAKEIPTYHLDRSIPFNDSDPTFEPMRVRSLHDLMARHERRMAAETTNR